MRSNRRLVTYLSNVGYDENSVAVNEVLTTIPEPITNLADLPANLSTGTLNANKATMDIDCTEGDVDLTDWHPQGLNDGAYVHITKTDDSDNVIKYKQYNYVDLIDETMTLMYIARLNTFRVV